MNSSNKKQSLEVYYCYAREDQTMQQALEKHLSNLKNQGFITTWHDREVTAGKDWAQEVDMHLESANIILFLVSPDFMGTNYCYGTEGKVALERHRSGKATVIPILLRSTDYQGAPFSDLKMFPDNKKPIMNWTHRDDAFVQVAKHIREIVEKHQLHIGVRTNVVKHISPQDVKYTLTSLESSRGKADVLEAPKQQVQRDNLPSKDTPQLYRPPEEYVSISFSHEPQETNLVEIKGEIALSPSSSLDAVDVQAKGATVSKRQNKKSVVPKKQRLPGLPQKAEQTDTKQLLLPFDGLESQSTLPVRKQKNYEEVMSEVREIYEDQPDVALKLFENIEIKQVPSKQRWRLTALRGHCYFGLGQFLSAQEVYSDAISQKPLRVPKEQVSEAILLYLKYATANRDLGDLAEAEKSYRTTIAQIDNTLTPVTYLAEAHWGLAMTLFEKAIRRSEEVSPSEEDHIYQIQQALKHAENARVLYEVMGEKINAASVMCDIALFELHNGNIEKSRVYLKEILKDWEPLLHQPSHNQKHFKASKKLISTTLCYLSEVELENRHYKEAIEHAIEAKEISKQGDLLSYAQATLTLGRALEGDNFKDPVVEAAYREAIQVLSKTEYFYAKAYAYDFLGRHLLKLGNVDEGERVLDLSRRLLHHAISSP